MHTRDWQGLAPANLYEGRDLRVTVDYREVMSAVLTQHLGVKSTSAIFPGFSGKGIMPLKLLRG